MKDRTFRILTALIEDFIETATPVASQKLLHSHNFNVSSATIRNEFSVLEEIGLIESPHVSAGKVPTQKGYRFWVDQLTVDKKKEAATREIFSRQIEKYKFRKSKESIFDVLRLLAQLSGNVAFATLDNDQTFYLGLSNVLRSPEFVSEPEKAARVVEILEGKDRLRELLDSVELTENNVKIFIGEENLIEEISSCALLVAVFKTAYTKGKIGILGPMRMRYGFNKALILNTLDMIL